MFVIKTQFILTELVFSSLKSCSTGKIVPIVLEFCWKLLIITLEYAFIDEFINLRHSIKSIEGVASTIHGIRPGPFLPKYIGFIELLSWIFGMSVI